MKHLQMKQIKLLMVLGILMVSTLGCFGCGIFDLLLDGDNEQVLEVNEDGSVEVNATAAADAEFAVQTRVAEVEATQQFLVENLQKTVQVMLSADAQSITPLPEETPVPVNTPPPPGVNTLSVSANTNCRSGPGLSYDRLDIVYVGQNVEVLGVDASGAYYIVRAPNGSTCWLWSHYVTLNGDTGSITVMTPPAPPETIIVDNWQDGIYIHISKDFSWEGHWVSGGPGGMTFGDWYNADVSNCDDCWRYASQEIDITRSGDYLEIIMTDQTFWLDGSTGTNIHYGIAQVSEDNSMAVGSFYLVDQSFSSGVTDSWTWEWPIVLYQNGNPDQFVGDFDSWPLCGAREGAAIPMPCTWP